MKKPSSVAQSSHLFWLLIASSWLFPLCMSLSLERPSPRLCEKLAFDWNQSNPYDTAKLNEGIEPLEFPASEEGCEHTQHCLFMEDDKLFNVLAASNKVFPTFQTHTDRNIGVHDVLSNSYITYDRHSVMDIAGVGTYKGSTSIGEYRVVPQFLVDMKLLNVSNLVVVPSLSFLKTTVTIQERWNHLANNTQLQSVEVPWSTDSSLYPCSIIRRQEHVTFPEFSAKAFSESGTIENVVESVCMVVMEHCEGKWKQYNSTKDCIEYLSSLTHHDPTCQGKYGEYATLGSSFMCKYLHHFMIPFSPPVHCAHTGKGLADINGKVKCTSKDCSSDIQQILNNAPVIIPRNKKPQSLSCTDQDVEEIAQATLYALSYCLPSLETQSCSENCTQAVNTYLGRLVESETLCSCKHLVPGTSRLLDLIQVDAETLVSFCSANRLLFKEKQCLSSYDHDRVGAKCNRPDQYLGKDLKCRTWDWSKIATGIFDEWTRKNNFGRVTKSDDVATAECHVFTKLYALHLNIHENQIPLHAKSLFGENIRVHPSGNQLVTAHQDVAAPFKTLQFRDPIKRSALMCELPNRPVRWMQYQEGLPITQNTSSYAHDATRAFISSVLPGLHSHVRPMKLDPDGFNDKGLLDSEELFRAFGKEGARVLIQGPTKNENPEWYEAFAKNIGDAIYPSISWFHGEAWHRSNGYLLGTAYIAKRNAIVHNLKQIIPESTMNEKLFVMIGLNVTTDQAYEMTADSIVALPFALFKLIRDVVVFIRRDPCRLIPIWERSPQRFIIEFARLTSPVTQYSTGVKSGSGTSSNLIARYHIASANRDPNVFPSPNKFDPDRDLSKVLSWNFLEGESHHSHARACPARSFSVKFIVANAPVYFPKDIKCANDHIVHSGVQVETYIPDLAQSESPQQSNIKVLRSKSTGSSETLFLFLHGFPDIPQEFMPIISQLRSIGRDDDYWMMNLWGWQQDTKESSCKLSEVAERITDFIISLKDKYKNIYLVGHDVGGMVGWYVVNNIGREYLSGFVTFAPQPVSFYEAVKRIKLARDVYFYKLMGPLIGSTYLAANDFKILHDIHENEEWWPEFQDEYHRAWDETGAKALTCYYRDNFFVNDDGRMEAYDSDAKHLKGNVNILMLSPTEDSFFPPPLFHHSLHTFDLVRGQVLQLRAVQGASHHGVLHGDSARDVASFMHTFTKVVERHRLSIFSRVVSVHSLLAPGSANNIVENDAVIITFFLTILGIAAGLTLEVFVGSKLRRYRKLIDGTHVIAVFAGFASKTYIGFMIAVAGTFKFGIPDISNSFRRSFQATRQGGTLLWRLDEFLQGIAMATHHFGALLVFASSPTDLITPISVLPIAIPLSLQHVMLIFDDYEWLLLFATMALEIWFQMEFFAAESLLYYVPRIGLYMVLIAHYLYLFLNGIEFFYDKCCQSSSSETKSTYEDSKDIEEAPSEDIVECTPSVGADSMVPIQPLLHSKGD